MIRRRQIAPGRPRPTSHKDRQHDGPGRRPGPSCRLALEGVGLEVRIPRAVDAEKFIRGSLIPYLGPHNH